MNNQTQVGWNQLRQEHQELEELQAEMIRAIAERHEPVSRIGSLLEAIRERAVAHFADEENGVIHDCADSAPGLAARCAALCDEHVHLKSQLDSILVLVNNYECSTTWWAGLEDAFQGFTRAFTDHENREQQLLDDIAKHDAERE